MIPIKKELKSMLVNSKIFEHCIFCGDKTNTWNIETNKPVCKTCSEIYDLEDINKKNMRKSYAAVDKNGMEFIFEDKPTKHSFYWYTDSQTIQLPKGSIKKLTGIDCTWNDNEPIELNF